MPTNFLSLSAELRNEIYSLALVASTINLSIKDRSPAKRNAGLLLANKQIHDEAIQLYYHSVTIIAKKYWHLERWVAIIPETYGKLVKEIRCGEVGGRTPFDDPQSIEDVIRGIWRRKGLKIRKEAVKGPQGEFVTFNLLDEQQQQRRRDTGIAPAGLKRMSRWDD